MNKIHLNICISLIAATCVPALAQNAGRFYGGVGIGQGQSKIDEASIKSALIRADATSTSITHDQRSGVYKLFGGFQFTRHIGLEAGYFNLGEFGFQSTTTPPGTLDGQINIDGINVDLVGALPLTDYFSVLGRIGVHNARSRDNFTSTGALTVTNPNPEIREKNYKAGLGFALKLNSSVALRGEVERYRINDALGNKGDIDVATISLVFPFGKTPEVSK